MFYLEFLPLSVRMLIITNPEVAIQANQVHNWAKPPLLHELIMDLSGGPHMFVMPETQWKPWRNIFGHGSGENYTTS